MPVYSFSQVQTYLQCPLKYKFRYVDKIVPEYEENLHLILWTEVHAALEWLYNQINNFNVPSFEELENFFILNFNQKAEKIDTEPPQKEEFLTRWKNYLKNFYEKHYPFDGIKVIWTEIQLYIELWDDIKFQGFIDRFDKKWEDFILTDYKTNRNLPPQDKSLYQEQLTLYALWVKQKYGKYFKKVFWNLEYLHFDIQDFWEITDENIEQVRQKYYELTKEIETKKAEYALGNKEAFPTNETSNCKFCEYKELCPLFAHFYWRVEDFELSEDTIKSMIDEYVTLSKQKSEIEKQMKQNKEILEKYAKRNDLKKLYGNKHTISISTLKNFKILDKEKLRQYLEEKNLLEEVLDIDKTKLKKLIQNKWLCLSSQLIQESESLVFRGM